MNKQLLKKYVETHRIHVAIRKSDSYPDLSILKYTKAAFYENKWNRYLEECRGTVIDSNWNVISRPFTKIYNLGIESNAPVLDDIVEVDAYRKVNGFMVSVSWYNNDILVSTSGSLESDFVDMAKSLIDIGRAKKVCKAWPTTTFIFECVHKNDPHIIPETPGLYLIGYRSNFWNSTVCIKPLVLNELAGKFGVNAVDYIRTTVGQLKILAKQCTHEGYVAYTDDGQAFKIKSPYYLVSKWLARKVNTDKITQPGFKQSVDEEYYPLVDFVNEHIEEFTAKSEQDRLSMIRQYLEGTV